MSPNRVLYRIVRAESGEVEEGEPGYNLRTNDGVDWQANHMGSGEIDEIRGMAITENSTAPSSSDTNLVAEESADGLSRTSGSFSHTASQSTYTLSASWQYTGGSTKTIAKAALASRATDLNTSEDTHFLITALTSNAVLTSNDTLTIDWGIGI